MSRILISSYRILKILKKMDCIAVDTDNFARIHEDPRKRLIIVSVDPKYIIKERMMNYSEMVATVKEGKRARRPTWKDDEFLWSDGKILIHNTPYFGEPFNQGIQGYIYVCEQVDVFATDWTLCG